MKYTIPQIPPSNNRYIGRTNFREYQRAKREWAEMIAIFCRPRPQKPIEKAVVRLTYFSGRGHGTIRTTTAER